MSVMREEDLPGCREASADGRWKGPHSILSNEKAPLCTCLGASAHARVSEAPTLRRLPAAHSLATLRLVMPLFAGFRRGLGAS